jgi:hypothetical protein
MESLSRLLVCVALVFASASILSASDSPLLSAPKVSPPTKVVPVADHPDLLVGLRKVGEFLGGGTYSSQLTLTQRLVRLLTPTPTTTYYRIQNDSQGLPALPYSLFAVYGSKSDLRFGIAYFDTLGGNITADVARGVHVLNIATGAETSLRQRVSRKSSAATYALLRVGAKNVTTLKKDVAGVLLQRP